MSRKKKLKMNILFGLLSQVITFICGFIVPRIILTYYGSEVNGLVSSITHFLSFISLAECGIGAVIQSSLYKPLADNNEEEVSKIMISSDRFFKKIGIILGVYVACLSVVYPLIINSTFNFWYIFTLILTISISAFIQYFFCMSYRLLITADQVGYIQLGIQIITTIVNTVLCIVLSRCGASIQIFKLFASLAFLIQPILLTIYVKKNYKLNKELVLKEEPIKQKWNGMLQHVAYVILENTDIVVLTLLSTLSNVSIYNVYYLVVNGIKSLIMASITGVQSMLGNMYAKGEKKELNEAFSYFEWLIHTGVTFLYTCTAILIVPFVRVYTLGINDANYIVPVFGILISLAQASFCFRLPYNALVFVAGHYKQTQMSALIEAIINIILSVLLVFKYGLIGVAIGTFVAMAYRTIYLAIYLTKNIINRPIIHFIKHIVIDICVVLIAYSCTYKMGMLDVSYLSWIALSIKVALIVAIISILINLVTYNNFSKKLVGKLFLHRKCV